MQQPKKRTNMPRDTRALESTRKGTPRPVGMQEMGPGMYEQIRQALLELAPVSGT